MGITWEHLKIARFPDPTLNLPGQTLWAGPSDPCSNLGRVKPLGRCRGHGVGGTARVNGPGVLVKETPGSPSPLLHVRTRGEDTDMSQEVGARPPPICGRLEPGLRTTRRKRRGPSPAARRALFGAQTQVSANLALAAE